MSATDDSRAAQLLISTEPAIQRAVHVRHAALSERLRTRLVAAFGDDSDLVAHLIVDVTGGTLHAALSAWGEQSRDAVGIQADALYRDARAVLRTLFS